MITSMLFLVYHLIPLQIIYRIREEFLQYALYQIYVGSQHFWSFSRMNSCRRGGKTQEQRDEKYTSKNFSLLLYFEKILLTLSSLAFAITCLNNGEVMNRARTSFPYTGTKPNERKSKKRQSEISPSLLPAAARKLSLIQFFF